MQNINVTILKIIVYKQTADLPPLYALPTLVNHIVTLTLASRFLSITLLEWSFP